MESEQTRRQRLYRVSAIVLKRRDQGEADRLLTVLTRDRGKLTLLAKGVRRQASRKAGHIEPFTLVDLLAAKGKSLDLVTQVETSEAHRALREDLWRSTWAYYVAELADAFTVDDDPQALLFDLLAETLDRLNRGDDPALAARYYELHLLGLVGYQPQLFRCVECEALLEPEVNFLSVERGGVLCPKHGAHLIDTIALPVNVLKTLRYLQTRDWAQVAQLQLSAQLGGQLETVLARYIVYHLERTLRSATFLARLRKQLANQQMAETAGHAVGKSANGVVGIEAGNADS
jgi:DNA repair protein RecO (recombination protein O)